MFCYKHFYITVDSSSEYSNSKEKCMLFQMPLLVYIFYYLQLGNEVCDQKTGHCWLPECEELGRWDITVSEARMRGLLLTRGGRTSSEVFDLNKKDYDQSSPIPCNINANYWFQKYLNAIKMQLHAQWCTLQLYHTPTLDMKRCLNIQRCVLEWL